MKLSHLIFISSIFSAGTTLATAGTAACCKGSDQACCETVSACCDKSPESRAQATTATTVDHAGYPLDTCVVTGEKLGSMGKPYEYIHRVEGQPDRVVLFCCKGCIKDFKKDPSAYLQKLDAAAAAKARS